MIKFLKVLFINIMIMLKLKILIDLSSNQLNNIFNKLIIKRLYILIYTLIKF